MKKGNIVDIGLRAVRDSGKTNMWHKRNVQYYAFHMGFFELVNWLEDNTHYATLLFNVDYNATPSVDAQYLLELENADEARHEVVSLFPDEVRGYPGGFFDFFPTAMKKVDFISGFSTDIMKKQIENHMHDHLFIENKMRIVWLSDGLFVIKDNQKLEPMTLCDWEYLDLHRDQFSNDSREKMKHLDRHFRLHSLFNTK